MHPLRLCVLFSRKWHLFFFFFQILFSVPHVLSLNLNTCTPTGTSFSTSLSGPRFVSLTINLSTASFPFKETRFLCCCCFFSTCFITLCFICSSNQLQCFFSSPLSQASHLFVLRCCYCRTTQLIKEMHMSVFYNHTTCAFFVLWQIILGCVHSFWSKFISTLMLCS